MSVQTERLELDDSYLREWTSRMTWLNDTEFTLEHSAFYPGGGGQVKDRGQIHFDSITADVECVGLRGGQVVVRSLDGLPSKPGDATFTLDWAHRYHAMRLHTAYHCIVGLAWKLFGARVAGGGMSDGRGRIDFSPEIDRAGIEQVVSNANQGISLGAPVSTYYLSADEVERTPELVKLVENRAPMTAGSSYRVVEIMGIDREVDGGTHVHDLSEVRSIVPGKISSAGRGTKRLKFTVA